MVRFSYILRNLLPVSRFTCIWSSVILFQHLWEPITVFFYGNESLVISAWKFSFCPTSVFYTRFIIRSHVSHYRHLTGIWKFQYSPTYTICFFEKSMTNAARSVYVRKSYTMGGVGWLPLRKNVSYDQAAGVRILLAASCMLETDFFITYLFVKSYIVLRVSEFYVAEPPCRTLVNLTSDVQKCGWLDI